MAIRAELSAFPRLRTDLLLLASATRMTYCRPPLFSNRTISPPSTNWLVLTGKPPRVSVTGVATFLPSASFRRPIVGSLHHRPDAARRPAARGLAQPGQGRRRPDRHA